MTRTSLIPTDRSVRIIDATLREGSQTPGGALSLDQSVHVAQLLRAANVDAIECGHPLIGPHEEARVRAVVEAAGETPVLSHARMCEDDIDAVARTGATWVGLFLGVNEASVRHRRTPRDSTYVIERAVKHAVGLGLQVRVTIEDGTRTPSHLMMSCFESALIAGASRLCLADTVGALEPSEVAVRVSAITSVFSDTPVEAHLHDDRGLAMANALAAIDAGASWVSSSVNGLGERAGITDTAALAVNLHLRGQRDLPGSGDLQRLSDFVAAYSRSGPDARRPVVGSDVFHHVARLHQLAVEKEPTTYESIDPAALGRTRALGETRRLPQRQADLITKPPVISATELRHHRHGPGDRYVLIDDRFVSGAAQYCIARRFPEGEHPVVGHVDGHVHRCDSLFVFLGEADGYEGLDVEVTLGDEVFAVQSPASVFIPAGTYHSYRAVRGAGTYLNHVLSGSYNDSLLD
ncbi:LeuA family protein [Nocardioides bruguierae]|uniref:2-isopropylmalate synthase n=1 Tax=Nocardioides bruguierae TaxID=2945102 RepID=A0A9X2DC29_9ACTN|nr:LeuA family protein [Nocardioides bruguierae]MCM0622622.1 LeuA family protein [Nocardioides bruguierae]